MKTTIWLVRHGETDWNASRRLQGSTDIELNSVGHAQAESVADRLAPIPFDAIFTSPLARTVQTATPLAKQRQLSPFLIPELAERNFGVFQGLTPEDISRQYPDDYKRWQARDPEFCPRGGESLHDFRARVELGLDSIIRGHTGQTIAVFSHGGVLDVIYRLAKNIDLQFPRDWPIPNAGIQQLLATVGSIEVLDWGMTDHLNGPSARDELRGIS